MEIIPDWRVLVVQASGFLLVLVVLKLFLFRPILELLERRRAEIDGRYASAEAAQSAAEQMRSEYETRLAGAEEEMRRRIAEAVKEAQAIREEIMADTRSQADRILTKAREQVTRETEHAMLELRAKIAELAIEAAGKIIEERMDPEKHRATIDRVIDGLCAASQAEPGSERQ